MDQGQHSFVVSFIWSIADDVLRDVHVRGEYRDVILPMVVIRRLDAVLEPTKQDVLKLSKQLDDAGVADNDAALFCCLVPRGHYGQGSHHGCAT